jgi:hypothetical protein
MKSGLRLFEPEELHAIILAVPFCDVSLRTVVSAIDEPAGITH